MIEGQTFLVLGEKWGHYPSTTEHLLRRLVPHNRFLWVDAIGCRAPEWSIYTLQRTWGKVVEWTSATDRSPDEERVAIYSPPVVPLPPIPAVRWWNRSAMSRGIIRRLKDLDMEEPILFATSPIAAEVMGDLRAKRVIYYILDNYEEMPHYYRRYSQELESKMMDHSDLVFATSQALVEKKSRPGRSVILLPQGVDFGHFHRPVAYGTPEPIDLAHIPRPRIVFMGLLAPWVDVDLLARVAFAYPSASLVLLGPVRTDTTGLRKAPNTVFLGPRPYAELPAYLAHCDVALIPFRNNALTHYVNPLKLLEYMAAGLPVVSTALPHLAAVDGLVYCARTGEQFLMQVGQAMTEFTSELRLRCVTNAEANGWDKRADQFSDHLRSSLAQTGVVRNPEVAQQRIVL